MRPERPQQDYVGIGHIHESMEAAFGLVSADLRHEIRLMNRTAAGIEGGKAATGRDQRGGEIKSRHPALDRDVGDADDISEVAAAGRDIAEGLQVPHHGGEQGDTRLAAIDAASLDIGEECPPQAALNAIEPEALAIRHPGVAGFEDRVGREGEPLVLGVDVRWGQECAHQKSSNQRNMKKTHLDRQPQSSPSIDHRQ